MGKDKKTNSSKEIEIKFSPLSGYQITGFPQEEDVLLSRKDADWRMNACLGYQYDENGIRIEGFRRAADILVHHIATHGSGQDHLIFPIANMYRHHLELLLKDIIQLGAHLKDQKVIPKGHKLLPLWEQCKQTLNEIWEAKESVENFQQIERILRELTALDPDGQNFRYGRRTDGTKPLQNVEIINIESFAIAIGKVSNLLSGALMGIWHYISLKYESESDHE